MKNDVDWRHIVAAVLVVGLIVYGGFRLLGAKPEAPNAKVTAGPNARTDDAPEYPPAVGTAAQGTPGALPAGLPQ